MDGLLADFLLDAGDKLAEAERAMLRLRRAPGDAAALSLAFRVVHTIKGTCGFVGLPRLEQALHLAEDTLEELREDEAAATPGHVAGVLRRLDDAKQIVAGLDLAGAGRDVSHVEPGLPGGIAAARPQPAIRAWTWLPRLVQGLARELGKQIDLTVRGRDAELDRELLALVRDPLTHMVRNSADHGIETPPERAATGKPERGRITLDVRHEDGHLVIELSDDGRGLSMDLIRAEALRRGIVTEAELSAMPDARAAQLIFHAGLSTAPVVTAISGRGVGLDAVRTSVEQLGGTIDVSSRPGRGTTFAIQVPSAPVTNRTSARAGEAERPTLLVVEGRGRGLTFRPPDRVRLRGRPDVHLALARRR